MQINLLPSTKTLEHQTVTSIIEEPPNHFTLLMLKYSELFQSVERNLDDNAGQHSNHPLIFIVFLYFVEVGEEEICFMEKFRSAIVLILIIGNVFIVVFHLPCQFLLICVFFEGLEGLMQDISFPHLHTDGGYLSGFVVLAQLREKVAYGAVPQIFFQQSFLIFE